MDDILEIKVENKHFVESESYTSNYDCPLALAIRDQLLLNGLDVNVGGITVDIINHSYDISKNWRNRKSSDVQQMIDDAKDGKEIETVIVTLKKY